MLGNYQVDGDDSYGLFMEVDGNIVFLDIREDKHLDKRKKQALWLFENSKTLDESYREYLSRNPEYKDKWLSYIGLHSDILERGEVFWEPAGYSVLKGLDILMDDRSES